MTVSQKAVVADALKSVRQHMDQEPADELSGLQGHRLLAIAISVILPAEPDLAGVDGQQAVVGDGDPMGISADVVENLFRPGERPLRVDHPVGTTKRREMTPERRWLVKVA